MPAIPDLPKILRGYRTITREEFNDGVTQAALFLCKKFKYHNFNDIRGEPERRREQLAAMLEPHHALGICGTEFQILAEDAAEKLFHEMPEDRRSEAKYRRHDKDFIANSGAFVRKAREYMQARDEQRRSEERKAKRAAGKAPRRALGLKKTIAKEKKAV